MMLSEFPHQGETYLLNSLIRFGSFLSVFDRHIQLTVQWEILLTTKQGSLRTKGRRLRSHQCPNKSVNNEANDFGMCSPPATVAGFSIRDNAGTRGEAGEGGGGLLPTGLTPTPTSSPRSYTMQEYVQPNVNPVSFSRNLDLCFQFLHQLWT